MSHALLCCLMLVATLQAEEGPLSGRARDEALRQRMTVDWSEQPVERALRGLAKQQGLNLVIDRRIDRACPIYGKLENHPLEKVFDMAAQIAGGNAVLIGDVVYIAPEQTADRAATAAALLEEELPRKLGNLPRVDVRWEQGATVGSRIEQIVKDSELPLTVPSGLEEKLEGDEVKDILPLDALLVLLAQNDRTLEVSKQKLDIVDLPESPNLERRIRLPRGQARALTKRYSQMFPGVLLEAKGSTLVATGSWLPLRQLETQVAIDRGPAPRSRGRRTTPSASERIRVSMRNTTLENFARQLSKVAEREVELDEKSLEAAGMSSRDRISYVGEANSVEDLLRLAIGKKYGYQVTDEKITITAPARGQ
ncbi:hypothetical protein Pan216_41130 [Planctomycetes bacterium Pan216]|uniref:Secretin/TonB short N-terminal domain-containing protein n=1 Tax=Kolteria novifilia TaxID=2527975 RepID=A0A518B8D0_9BACT|nr:hypothetical protein Pan216_41130 [Planctomycetes bacterium Pan216]